MIWRTSEVLEGVEYKLALCQDSHGVRELRILQKDEAVPSDCIFATQSVPTQLLRKRDVISIAEQVPLDDGTRFYVDAHGIWFSQSESIQRSSGVEHEDIQWVTPFPPKLPPA